MRKFSFSSLVITTAIMVSPSLLLAEPNYPERTQIQIQKALYKDVSQHLRRAFEQYNQGVARQSGATESAKKTGLSDREIAQITTFINKSERSLPKAEWEDGSIKVQDGGYTVVLGINEYWNRSITINGKTFSWDWTKSALSNLGRYNTYFSSNSKTESSVRLPNLIENAWADELFRIKAAGLQLYFVVTATGEMGEQLYRLNTQVKKMIALCKAPEPSAGQDDPFLKATLQGTAVAQRFESSVLLRNCKSVKDFAKNPVGVIQNEPVMPKIPADLCSNLSQLANCVHTQMDHPAASNKAKKETPPADKDEWYEPQKSKSAGTAQ